MGKHPWWQLSLRYWSPSPNSIATVNIAEKTMLWKINADKSFDDWAVTIGRTPWYSRVSQINLDSDNDGIIIVGDSRLHPQGSNYWTTGNSNLHENHGSSTYANSNSFTHKAEGDQPWVSSIDGNGTIFTTHFEIDDNGNMYREEQINIDYVNQLES